MIFEYRFVDEDSRDRSPCTMSTQVAGALNHREDRYEEIFTDNGEDIYLCLGTGVTIRVSQTAQNDGKVWLYTHTPANNDVAAGILRDTIKMKKLGLEAIA